MTPSAVGVKEGHDVDGRDLCVKGVGVFEVVVPNFIDKVVEKLGHASLSPPVAGIVIEAGFVGSLRTNTNDRWHHHQLSYSRVGDKPGVLIWHHGWLHA